MFSAGDIVVCLADFDNLAMYSPCIPCPPKKNCLYIIRSFMYGNGTRNDKGYGVWLNEIIGQKRDDGFELGFSALYFRKVADYKKAVESKQTKKETV